MTSWKPVYIDIEHLENMCIRMYEANEKNMAAKHLLEKETQALKERVAELEATYSTTENKIKDHFNGLDREIQNLRQIKSSMSDVIDQKDVEIEDLKVREIAHLTLIRDLQFQLADRSEKYRIAMDKGVDILADRVKQRDELLRECEEALDQSLRQWEMYAKFSDYDMADQSNTEAMLFKAYSKTLQKLREGKP